MTSTAANSALLDAIRSLTAQPTAPFYEDAVAAEIERLLASCPHVSCVRDPFGNLVATYRRGKRRARWAFAAHMDHPGWVRNRQGEWRFLGGVPKETLARNSPRMEFSNGAFAMWDLPPFELRDDRIHSRACDDLIGCAAIVATFQELEKTEADATCIGLFTRAEEVGFVGAMRLANSGLIPAGATVLSLETSAERPPAKIGEGAIIRVGDRTSIFDPAVTAELESAAAAEKVRVQRCLMPGGTCEATAYALYGYRCGALCVALGNYHNVDPRGEIAAESVALSDVGDLSALCTGIVRRSRPTPKAGSRLKQRLIKNLREHRDYFRPLATAKSSAIFRSK